MDAVSIHSQVYVDIFKFLCTVVIVGNCSAKLLLYNMVRLDNTCTCISIPKAAVVGHLAENIRCLNAISYSSW